MRVLILSLLLVLSASTYAQQASQQQCDPAFVAEIDSYLQHTVPTMTVTEAYAAADQYVFLDAREKEEYLVSHIPDARHVGYRRFKAKKLADLDRDTPIVVYCSIGYRSEKVGEKLQKAGFTNVTNLYGSIFQWVNQGYPIATEHDSLTTDVHTYNKKWSKWVTNSSYNKVW